MDKYLYYHSADVEQFTFFRLPKKLIRDKRFGNLSSDAKILYGVMMDRMTLSMKNGWVDEENRVYIIYTVKEVMEELGCSERKAIMLMSELDTKNGIGLIEKRRQGLGRPNLIYVRNFNQVAEELEEVQEEITYPMEDVETEVDFEKDNMNDKGEVPDFKTCKNVQVKTCKNVQVKTCKNMQVKTCKNLQVNNETDNNENNINNINNQSIYQSYRELEKNPDSDRWMDRELVLGYFQEKLDYSVLICDNPEKQKQIDEIFMLIVDFCSQYKGEVRFGNSQISVADVRRRMILLNLEHIRYVLGVLENNSSKIKNIRSYMFTCLYNAPTTMGLYYQLDYQSR